MTRGQRSLVVAGLLLVAWLLNASLWQATGGGAR
jgi:uncharacterized membrane protein